MTYRTDGHQRQTMNEIEMRIQSIGYHSGAAMLKQCRVSIITNRRGEANFLRVLPSFPSDLNFY